MYNTVLPKMLRYLFIYYKIFFARTLLIKRCQIFFLFFHQKNSRNQVQGNLEYAWKWWIRIMWIFLLRNSICFYIICASSIISICVKWNLCHLTWHLSYRFLIQLWHYGLSQLYLLKVPLYLIGWRLLVYNSVNCVIYVWGGFQNNTLKYILLLYIVWERI